MTVIDDIKARLDIVDVISGYTSLSRSGQRYKAPCPFHQEKTASFMVYPDRQTWHCYGACASGGDVFTFVMKMENLEFSETLKRLAQQTGIALPDRTNRTLKKDILEINEEISSFFQSQLSSDLGSTTKAYLQNRGISEDSISKFELGYSPKDGTSALKFLTNKGIPIDKLVEAGVVRQYDQHQFRDWFRGRLTIPIRNGTGELCGFGSRALDNSNPKYLNSGRTAVFDKGKILYGMNFAKDAGRTDGIVIVEGYMDAIMAHQYYFTNVVASMGTALTSNQVSEVKKLTNSIVMALDPDLAGQQATLRSLSSSWGAFQKTVISTPRNPETMLFNNQNDLELKIVSLPDSLDPDELIRRSPKEWSNLLEDAQPLFDYLLPVISNQMDISTPQGKSLAVEILLPFITGVADPLQQDLYLQQLAAHLDIPEYTLKSNINRGADPRAYQSSRNSQVKRGPQAAVPASDYHFSNLEPDPIEEYCLSLSIRFPALIPESGLMPEFFSRPGNRELAQRLIQLEGSTNTSEISLLLGIEENSPLKEQLDNLLQKTLPPIDSRNRLGILQNTVRRLEDRFLRELKLEEQLLLEQDDPDLSVDPDMTILNTNLRLKNNETSRNWINTVSPERR